MTGRRLYELVADGWAATQPSWERTHSPSTGEGAALVRTGTLPAWPFLTAAERAAWGNAAARIRGVRR